MERVNSTVRTFVNVIVYPQYNNKIIIFKRKKGILFDLRKSFRFGAFRFQIFV
jgi:hypothetical protein